MACADSGYVSVRWPRWLRWFRPNHSWSCPQCQPTRFDRVLNLTMWPVWRIRALYSRIVDRNKPNDEHPF